ALDDLKSMVDAAGLYLVVGFAGRDQQSLYNGALLMAPNTPARLYRKTHLPYLGFDRYSRAGDRLMVWETDLGKIAPLICFDLRVPEAARTLALSGAELIVLPTNWPNGASVTPKHIAPTRAAENKVYLVTCDRVGTENGFTFIGQSAIYDPYGIELAKAGDAEELIVADIDLAVTRNKRNVLIPGEYEIDPFATRQPNLYRPLTSK
ncbi:MAG: carbon-nitrogen hydrolase family protein, partial [Armatimonadetes bacterium]|nr:carbon-nitrogen hydrolase family protein [Armatimonadota bacterium]